MTVRHAKFKLQFVTRSEEPDMPRTIPLVSNDANAELLHSNVRARETNSDLIVIVTIIGVGLLLTMELCVFFPLAANAVSLAWSVT